MTAYHVYYGYVLKPYFYIYYPMHLGLALAIIFADSMAARVDAPPGRRRLCANLVDGAFLVVVALATGYLVMNAQYVMNRMTGFDRLTMVQLLLGIGLTIAVLEAIRRVVGMVLVIVVAVFLAYAVVGPWLPGLLWHQGVKPERIIELLYLTPEGFFNSPLKVAADFVLLFVTLGALLLASGAGGFFTDISFALTGRSIGGPAKASIVSSAFMGMLQGSSNGNVATTGPFTIPAMERYGYPKDYAAGVEAVASTGGSLTPPIMGAAAFLMAEVTGIPYVEIMIAAAVPALLYYLAVLFMVDLEARKRGLALSGGSAQSALTIFLARGYLIAPIIVMVWFLMDGYSPARAGFYGVTSLAVLLLLDGQTRRRYFAVLFEAAARAPKMMVAVTAACAAAGLIAGIIVRTGLNLKLGLIVLNYAEVGNYITFLDNGQLLVGLFLTMVIAVVLGMGVPTTAAYVVLASLLAPGLANMGASVVAAHLFIIYCASKSSITPPVAVASYTAAAICGSDPWRTSLIAFRLGLSVFIIPYIFVFSPALLADGSLVEIVWAGLTATFGIFALSVGSTGWLKVDLVWYERLLMILVSLPMIYAGWGTDILGFVMFGATLGLIALRVRVARGRVASTVH
ncbi:TRAP transporter fused permease subunit [Acuticoccus sp. 2012]|uniref:TRAP transporter fused permease subunit n=2 Tax=Acuticoccus mangrovi TaxID=2796142 RepID=A0A934IR22_9HYPH|nr:TRAP transporter fused permease subunit [Acuticoccus mangrovi]